MTHTALILAARRRGERNPIAEMYGVSHKCLAPVGGEPMIERVVRALTAAKHVGPILISIDQPEVVRGLPAIEAGVAAGRIGFTPAGETLFASVRDGLADAAFPAIVTTADNLLHTAQIVDHFCDAFHRAGCDVGVAMTPIETVWAKYPEGQRKPHVFRDGRYSNCNLYGLRAAGALSAAQAFRSGGQFRKKKLRVLKEFGLINYLRYRYGRFGFDELFQRVSTRFGLDVRPIILPFAEAPIDVDNLRNEKVAREILALRDGAAG